MPVTCQGVVQRANASRVPPSRPQGFQICSPGGQRQRGTFRDDVAVDEPFDWVEDEREVGFNFDVFSLVGKDSILYYSCASYESYA